MTARLARAVLVGRVVMGGLSAGCVFDGLGTGGAGRTLADAGIDPGQAALDAPPDSRRAGRFDLSAGGVADDSAGAGALPLLGPPETVGCADGSREGFLDLRGWRRIAGCAGAWDQPGLLSPATQVPGCSRQAGNTGTRPTGQGCSVTDLCAQGWHVCQGPADVNDSSPTGCESAAPDGSDLFFLARGGASPQGICTADPTASNDLHGCGTRGSPETESCQPLEKRMGFVECAATAGIWGCGDAVDHLNEAALVRKTDNRQGGVLCCRD